ncbi:MAG: DNA/RNA non-specific endonuclease [Lachnospiraceae bacterium]
MIFKSRKQRKWAKIVAITVISLIATACTPMQEQEFYISENIRIEETIKSVKPQTTTTETLSVSHVEFSLENIPVYSGKAYITVNNNIPYFTDTELTTTAFETYSNLDALGRCGVAYANICMEIMPTEKREGIGSVKPTGWHTIKYDCVDGKYLYNRCHLIGFQLAGENANTKNLITGTRYLNIDGILPFENMIADYVKETNHHVLYRVTPIYDGNNLIATGVLLEAKSVEDNGEGILFNVFCYNNQPGVVINYADGSSQLEDAIPITSETEGNLIWVPTNGGKKYHSKSSCSSMKEPIQITIETAQENSFEACKRCIGAVK